MSIGTVTLVGPSSYYAEPNTNVEVFAAYDGFSRDVCRV